MIKIISENNNWCSVNYFIFCMFLYLFIFLFLFVENDLLVTSDVIVCIGYTISADTLNLCEYMFRNNSKNKCLVKIIVLAVCLLG